MRAPVPQPPFTDREFRIDFDFGTDILTDQLKVHPPSTSVQ